MTEGTELIGADDGVLVARSRRLIQERVDFVKSARDSQPER